MSLGTDVHPTETAGDGKPLRDVKHRAPNEQSNNLWIPCPHCGMRNKVGRDAPTNKEGEATKYVDVQVAIPGGTTTMKDYVRISGCLFCRHDFTQNTYKQPLYNRINLAGR